MYHQLLKIRWPAENNHQSSTVEELLTISHYIQNCHEQWTLPSVDENDHVETVENSYLHIYVYYIYIHITCIYIYDYICIYYIYTYYMYINRPASDASLWSSSSFLPWPQPPHLLRRSRSQLRREEPIAGDAGSFAELTWWAMPSRVCTDNLVVGIYIYIWDIGYMYVYMIILPYSAYLDSLTLITQCEEPWEPQLLLETCHHTSTWVYLYGTWPGRRIAMCYRKRNQSTVVIGWNWFVLLKHSNNIPSQKKQNILEESSQFPNPSLTGPSSTSFSSLSERHDMARQNWVPWNPIQCFTIFPIKIVLSAGKIPHS